MADGWITIGTKLSTDKFDKQLADLEKKIEKEEKNKQIKISTYTKATKDLEDQKQKVYELEKEYEVLAQKVEKINAIREKQANKISLTPQEFTDLQGADAIISQTDKLGIKLDSAYQKEYSLKLAVEKTKNSYEQASQKVEELKQNVGKINMAKQAAEAQKFKDNVAGAGNNLKKAVTQASKLALGIFAVRSAYMLVRQASSQLATYDEQYAANIEYIKYALANTITPLLKGIVGLVSTILSYVNAISSAWFGKSLFASAEDFNNMKKSASGVASSAKEINKQLSGFDEMNVLSSQTSSSSGGGASSVTPDIDLSSIQGKVPEWLQFIIDHKDEFAPAFAGIVGGLAGLKAGLTPLQSLGLGLIVDGILRLIENFKKMENDPTFENVGKSIQNIGEIVAGVALIFGSLPLAAVAAATLLYGIFLENWEKIKGFFQKIIDYFRTWGDWIEEHLGKPFRNVWDAGVDASQDFLNFFDEKFTSMKGQIAAVMKFIKAVITGNWDEAKEAIDEGYSAWEKGIKGQWEALKNWLYDQFIKPIIGFFQPIIDAFWEIYNPIKEKLEEVFSKLWESFKTVADKIKEIKDKIAEIFNAIKYIFNEYIVKPIWDNFLKPLFDWIKEKIIDPIKNLLEGVGSWIYDHIINPVLEWFKWLKDKVVGIFKTIGETIADFIGGMIKNAVNGVFTWIENAINFFIRMLNGAIDLLNTVPGVSITRVSELHIPRLATGGIVNMPNRGTMVGSAIAGESGREGVIPLTDTQAMETLGEAIGRYIKINANITNTMNGRVISRQLQQIQNEQNFAYNG